MPALRVSAGLFLGSCQRICYGCSLEVVVAETHQGVMLVPGDGPVRVPFLRRLLLNFDSVSLLAPDETHLVRAGEYREALPNGSEIYWANVNPFPVTREYLATQRTIYADLQPLIKRGVIRTVALDKKSASVPDHWFAFHRAIGEQSIMDAAARDRASDLTMPSGLFMVTNELVFNGHRSALSVSHPKSCVPTGESDPMVHAIAWGRTARVVRVLKVAQAQQVQPLADDSVSAAIMRGVIGLSASAQSQDPHDPSAVTIKPALLAVSLEVVDPVALEQRLGEMTWQEVLELRKRVLPGTRQLRRVLRAVAETDDPDAYRQRLDHLRDSYARAAEEYLSTWEHVQTSLGVAALGSVSTATLTALFVGAQWGALMGTFAGLVQTAVAGAGQQLGDYRVARRRYKGHVLAFTSELDPAAVAERRLLIGDLATRFAEAHSVADKKAVLTTFIRRIHVQGKVLVRIEYHEPYQLLLGSAAHAALGDDTVRALLGLTNAT